LKFPPIRPDDNLAAACNDSGGERHRLFVAGEVNNAVRSAVRFFQDALGNVCFRRIVSGGRAVLERCIAGRCAEISDRDRLLEHRLSERDTHHADTAEADQQDIALAWPIDETLQRA
jgi:hypothetical protein